jgi:type VI secretion system protein ImpL
MNISRRIWIPVTVLLLWLLLSWLVGGWMGLHPPALYYSRGGLSILGIVGFIGYLLLRPKGGSGEEHKISTGEMDDNFNEAAKRLQASGVKQVAALPAVFFLGDTDTAKTSVIVKSDIAQLLAGQAQQDVSILPTRAANFWLAKSAIFVDPAGALMADPDNRRRLFRRFSSMAMGSVMGSRQLPARSVVFTVSCETLLQQGGAEMLGVKARQFQTVLAEMAQELGSRFPVYVLFTKADKISYFRDYVENLSDVEIADVFGVTLPIETEQGVYAQQQAKRVNDGFQQLYYWLSDRRPTYLIREHKPEALPNIYEFPREFNKLRPLITSFLVDLCRPSQLGLSPFLRGFYFTGVRATTVSDVAPAAMQVPDDSSGMDSGATRMFSFPKRGAAPMTPEFREAAGARKIAQWVFLQQLLPGVVLADGTATSVGAGNVKLNVARRALLGGAMAAALLMGLWWTISYSNNHALVHGALDAAQGAPSVPSLDGLERLTRVKNTLETLNSFEENGRPLSYAAFLYSGDDARDSVRKTYYGLFRRLLLAPTQENLVQVCSAPSAAQPQRYLYDSLKSYLITTEFHDKSVPEFLTPTLLTHWKLVHLAGIEEERLARINFDFYARELLNKNENWPPTAADAGAVGTCRDYLNGLGQTEPIYRRILVDASAHDKPIIFNDDYPGTEATVVNRFPVEAAFTKAGFSRFQDALKNIRKYADGEAWVLGPRSAEILDKTKLLTELQRLYRDDFIKAWQGYLQATRVREFGNVSDAVGKLDKLSSARSALLQVLCVASENTAPANNEMGNVFQPVQYVTPPGCLQSLVGGPNTPYMGKLVASLESLKALDADKPDTYDAANHVAADIETTVKEIALNFKGSTDEVVTKLLKEPIYTVRVPMDPAAGNAAESACRAIQPILNKYPFRPDSPVDATMPEVDGFLKNPDGSLWKLINNPAITALVTQYGDSFSAKTSGKSKPREAFLRFLNRAAALSRALYGPDGKVAGFKFTINPVPSPDVVEHVTLTIDGDIQSTDVRGTPTKEFQWPGNSGGVEDLTVRFIGGTESRFARHPGLWGVWHFLDNAREVRPGEFELIAMDGKVPITTNKGLPEAIHLIIDPSKAPMLRPRYFAISCVSQVN